MKRLIQVLLMLTLMSGPVYAEDFLDIDDAFIKGDYKIAYGMLEKLAEQGNAKAQFQLGFEYKHNIYGNQNCKKARKWMHAAIDQNYPNAFEEMGFWYRWGRECVSQNFKEAVRLFQIGADMGHPPAQFALGLMYFEGLGVAQNYVIAHSYSILGAISGYDAALHLREKTRKLMSPSQIENAQEMARNWEPKK